MLILAFTLVLKKLIDNSWSGKLKHMLILLCSAIHSDNCMDVSLLGKQQVNLVVTIMRFQHVCFWPAIVLHGCLIE